MMYFERKCVKCRINNLTVPMRRKQTMRAISAMQLVKGKTSEDHR